MRTLAIGAIVLASTGLWYWTGRAPDNSAKPSQRGAPEQPSVAAQSVKAIDTNMVARRLVGPASTATEIPPAPTPRDAVYLALSEEYGNVLDKNSAVLEAMKAGGAASPALDARAAAVTPQLESLFKDLAEVHIELKGCYAAGCAFRITARSDATYEQSRNVVTAPGALVPAWNDGLVVTSGGAAHADDFEYLILLTPVESEGA